DGAAGELPHATTGSRARTAMTCRMAPYPASRVQPLFLVIATGGSWRVYRSELPVTFLQPSARRVRLGEHGHRRIVDHGSSPSNPAARGTLLPQNAAQSPGRC